MAKVKLQDVDMFVLGQVRKVQEVNMTVYPDGSRAVSFDEFKRIEEEIDEQIKRRNRYEAQKRSRK